MVDLKALEKKIREKIEIEHHLGEHAGGSGHLSFRSLIEFIMEDPKEIVLQGKRAYEITYKFAIYTETEFLHPPDQDDYYTERHQDKVIVDDDLNFL
ncbi:MAG: hypothetical protein EAX96_12055 [Candidatus Lokiarchaeota archaeon]|nr:hypothetical protein [Candidatus Lokiarchaeota archaeon]